MKRLLIVCSGTGHTEDTAGITTVFSADEACRLIKRENFDLLVSDRDLPEAEIQHLLKGIKLCEKQVPMLITDPDNCQDLVTENRPKPTDELYNELKKRRYEDDLNPNSCDLSLYDLKEANMLLKLINSTVRHNILNQVHIATGYTALLIDMMADNPDMQNVLQIILGAASDIQRQILYTLDYQDIRCQNPGWEHLETVVDKAGSAAPLSGISLETSGCGVEVYTVPLFELVFLNILDNSVRHGESVTNIGVSFVDQGTHGLIVVEDNGAGVSDDLKMQIFGRGIGMNTGLGLFLAGEILGITGLSIRETGIEGQGARFEIIVPEGCYRVNAS